MNKKTVDFNNFYVYEGNKVAFVAAQKIVQFPGEIFNPLYIYANGSFGKTYFLRALHEEFSKKESALLFTPKEFEDYLQNTNQFDSAIFVDDINRINEKYHDQLLAMIDMLIAKNKQICFSGNVPPRELKNFSTKLISRLEGGLVCDLQAPREMALVNFIKKKSEERGIIIPDDIALELTQLSGGSFRVIDGMLNRLVAYASLGNINFDLNTVRIILKEFYPRGIYSPVASLVEELKKSADAVLSEISEKKDPHSDFKEKIYIWEMKGFDTSELKPLLEGDIEKLASAYNAFIKKVERLIELQKEFGAIDSSKSPEEAMKIETMLFSPDRIEEIESLLEAIRTKIKSAEKRPFENYLISECNKTVIELYEKTILPNLGKKFNPYVILGKKGTGKSLLCMEIAADLKSRGHTPLIVDFDKELIDLNKNISARDSLLIDNFHKIFQMEENLRNEFADIIFNHIKNEYAIFVFSEPFGEHVKLTENEKLIFELAVEADLRAPDRTITEEIMKSKVTPAEFEQMVAQGIPGFENFYEIDEFINKFRGTPETVEMLPAPEIVNLGLPGEEKLLLTVESTESVAVTPEPQEQTEAKAPLETSGTQFPVETPLKKINEQKLLVQEIMDELLEENYPSLEKQA